MKALQQHALVSLRHALELCKLAGLAMTPATGGVHVMYRVSKNVWYRAPGGKLSLPDVPEMIRNEDAETARQEGAT